MTSKTVETCGGNTSRFFGTSVNLSLSLASEQEHSDNGENSIGKQERQGKRKASSDTKTCQKPAKNSVPRSADRHALVEVVCQHCGAHVLGVSRGNRPPQKFCGNACAAASAKATGKFRGENNPRFAGWKSKNKVAYRKLFETRYPEKAAAHRAVRHALDRGVLVRQPCESCGEPKGQAHHDSYLPEHHLMVRWLCRSCHRAWHAANDRPMGRRRGA